MTELTLDPSDARGAEAGRPELDEDYLILSTIHSAKGQEWDAVVVLNLATAVFLRIWQAAGPINTNITDDMRSGSDQRPRGRFNENRPFKQQPRIPQNGQIFDSSGPNIKMRGSAYQIFERYLALAREATASGDRIAAEHFYQRAEHFFRVNNARRESNQQGTRLGRQHRTTSI